MQYVHLARMNPMSRKPYPDNDPQGHVYVNPAAVAKVQGMTEDTAYVYYIAAEVDPDLVAGFAPDIAKMFEDSNREIVDALDRIDEGLTDIQRAVEGIDCG